MNGVYTISLLATKDFSGIFVTNACSVFLHHFLAQVHYFRQWLDQMGCGILRLEKNNSYDWILQTQDCDFIAQHLQLDKRF